MQGGKGEAGVAGKRRVLQYLGMYVVHDCKDVG